MTVPADGVRALPPARRIQRWYLLPLAAPGSGMVQVEESASVEYVLEKLQVSSEIKRIGRQRFSGALADKNRHWANYRNYIRQAISNYLAARAVSNRSACLLYYYSLLNFTKAELELRYSEQVGGRIGHGLSFSVTDARTVSGDYLTVRPGLFRFLYEHRTGISIPENTRLRVAKLLHNIPEIGEQVFNAGLGLPQSTGVLSAIAIGDGYCWSILAVPNTAAISDKGPTGRLFRKVYRQVAMSPVWRENFGASRRWFKDLEFYESIVALPIPAGQIVHSDLFEIPWSIHDIISASHYESYEAILTPYVTSGRHAYPMPASLARYAVMFYASSLVRYRPSMFDPEVSPEQAYLFDAIARECSMPLLLDVLDHLHARHVFYGDGSLRT